MLPWPLLLVEGILLPTSPAMSMLLHPRYNVSNTYPPETPVQFLWPNLTASRISFRPDLDPNQRGQEEIRRRTKAVMKKDSPYMKKIAARIALLGMVMVNYSCLLAP